MKYNSRVKLIVDNKLWKSGPNLGFLTPTAYFCESENRQFVYGAVRDNSGRAVIRGVELLENLESLPFRDFSLDRRGSEMFDQDGTILGHVNKVGDVVRLYYVGFRRPQNVKFEAFSGLAESYDGGKTFIFRRKIFDSNFFKFLNGSKPSIVACHWNNLDFYGNGMALIAIGSDWLEIGERKFPKYSSYLINVENFQCVNLVCALPQSSDIYRLGRPRFIFGNDMRIAVATGGKSNGDYRPYFFEFTGTAFIPRLDYSFPIQPGSSALYKQQVSYPEFIKFPNSSNGLFLFNGDNMGELGCFAFQTDCHHTF
jgi:hypothetical protein